MVLLQSQSRRSTDIWLKFSVTFIPLLQHYFHFTFALLDAWDFVWNGAETRDGRWIYFCVTLSRKHLYVFWSLIKHDFLCETVRRLETDGGYASSSLSLSKTHTCFFITYFLSIIQLYFYFTFILLDAWDFLCNVMVERGGDHVPVSIFHEQTYIFFFYNWFNATFILLLPSLMHGTLCEIAWWRR